MKKERIDFLVCIKIFISMQYNFLIIFVEKIGLSNLFFLSFFKIIF